MTISSQLDLSLGAKRRDRGMESALSRYSVAIIRDVIEEVARRGQPFTTDEVYQALPDGTRLALATSPNVMGALVFRMAKEGRLIDSGRMKPSARPEARGRRIVVWLPK